MKKKAAAVTYVITFLLSATLIAGCASPAPIVSTEAPAEAPVLLPPDVEIIVNPDVLDILAGDKVGLSLKTSGVDLSFSWSATRGNLEPKDDIATIYTAPLQPGVDIVSVAVNSASGTTIENIQFNIILPPTEPVVQIEPTPENGLPMIADFNECKGENNLAGAMGAAFNAPDDLIEKYVPEDTGDGCMARLEYHLEGWAAFWMKLQGANLGDPYKFLAFDIKGDPNQGIPQKIKIEAKGSCNSRQENCEETSIIYISGIMAEWQTVYIELSPDAWDDLDYIDPLPSFEKIGQLVFTVEANQSGTDGVFYLDNVRVSVDRD